MRDIAAPASATPPSAFAALTFSENTFCASFDKVVLLTDKRSCIRPLNG
jgi:hypothetical protein